MAPRAPIGGTCGSPGRASYCRFGGVPAVDPEGGHAMSHAKPTVFVVDENASVRASLKSLIESAGWEAETFASGLEFLSRSRMLAPSCLVLDLALPDIN